MLTAREKRALRAACARLDYDDADERDYRCNDYIENLLLTAMDFQVPAFAVATKAVKYFKKEHGFTNIKQLKRLLAKYPNTKRGNRCLANILWNNRHWTRARFLRTLVSEFEKRRVKDQRSLVRWLEKSTFEEHVEGKFRTARRGHWSPGRDHSLGYVLYNWLLLRCGFDTVKADSHVLNFVANAVGRTVSKQETTDALTDIAHSLHRRPYQLDAAIWHHEPRRLKARHRDR